MDERQLFEELTAPSAAQRHPTASHHYVADEETMETTEEESA